MVTALIAELTDTTIRVHDGTKTLATYRAKGDELEGDAAHHGINLDAADEILENKLGYVAGHWRWHDSGGGYYKTVVTVPVKREPWKPKTKDPFVLNAHKPRRGLGMW